MRKRGDRWQADFTLPNGRRIRKAFATAREAEAWEARAKAMVLSGKLEGIETVPELGFTLKQAFDGLASLPASRGGWAGLKAEDTQVLLGKLALRFYGQDTPVSAITTAEVDRYVSALVTDRKSGATINRRLSGLSKLLRYAMRMGHLDRLPDLRRQQESQGRLRWITRDEEARILSTLHLWGRHDVVNLVIFLVDTGARLGEALNLSWDAVGPRSVTFWDTKNGRPRTVPLTSRVQRTLKWMRESDPTNPPFGALTRVGLRQAWDRLRQHLGLHDVVLHTLRHTCASRLVQAGMDLRRTQEWLGHRTLSMTTRYAHLAPTDLERGAELLEKSA